MLDLETTPAEAERRARSLLARGVALYGGFLLATIAALGTLVFSGLEGAKYVWLAIVTGVGLLLAQQAWSHLRDLQSAPEQYEGELVRKWQRAEMFIAWQTYYAQVGRRIFRLTARDHLLLDAGKPVRVWHYPRTLTVIRVERIEEG